MPMIKNTNNLSLTLSLNILKALGGDTSVQYDTVDDVWVAINEIYGRAGDGIDISAIILDITENGQYNFDPNDDVDAFAPVHLNVNVPQKYTDEQVANLQNTARQEGYQDGFVDGESEGEINQKAKLIDIEITDNGVYETENGYKKVTVAVEQGIPDDELQQMLQEAMDEGYQDGYAEGVDDGYEDGAAEQKEKLTSVTFKDNGTYTREDGWNEVTVEVEIPTIETETLSVELKSNGNYNYTPTTDGYSSVSVIVDVPTSGGGDDDGKPKVYNGFCFTGGGYVDDIDFSQYDWSNVYDTSNFFKKCTYNTDNWSNFLEHFNGRIMSCYGMFYGNNNKNTDIKSIPALGDRTANCEDFTECFYNCAGLSASNTGNLKNWNTSKAKCCAKMFYNCKNLTNIQMFNTSGVIDMQQMFYQCGFSTAPQMDVSNVLNVYQMFYYNSSLTTIPDMNFKKLSNFCQHYGYASASWLQSCSRLTTLGVIDCDSIRDIGYVFGNTTNNNIVNCGGFRNLGKVPLLVNTDTSYFMQLAPNLTYESLINIFNNLYDRASAGYSILTLKLHATQLSKLSDEDIAIATNKGWTIA